MSFHPVFQPDSAFLIMRPHRVLCLVLASASLAAGLRTAGATSPHTSTATMQRVDIEEIRSLFERRCVSCHGPKRARGGLRIDTRAAIELGGNSGLPALVPWDAGASEILARVTTDDVELRMPLDQDPLADREIEALRQWIEEGAPWPQEDAAVTAPESEHWAYQPWRKPTVPELQGTPASVAPIDRFVRARLVDTNLEPAPEADRTTLLRRLSFDLIGLPPTPADVEYFLADDRPDAYERLVERLLASPHFGERWARHWLDLARYADSDGGAFDNERVVWPYRDWIIDAFNADMPFDCFTIAQLAGDLMLGATRADHVATGFHRNTTITEEDGVDDEEFRIEAVKNRVETTGTVWMGTTMNCAQCHDHKYDPISTRDYYRMFALFNNTEDCGRLQGPYMSLPEDEEAAELARIDARITELKRTLITPTAELREAQYGWEQEIAASEFAWTLLDPLRVSSNNGVELVPQKNASVLATGPSPDVATYHVSAATDMRRITAVRLEVLCDPEPNGSEPERTSYGGFVLTGFSVTASPLDGHVEGKPAPRTFSRATASYEQDLKFSKGPIEDAIDGDRGTGWGVFPEVGRAHEAVFDFAEPIDFENGTLLNVELEQGIGNRHTIGLFRLSLTSESRPPRARPTLSDELDTIRRKPLAARTAAESAALETHFLSLAPPLEPIRKEIERLEACRPEPARTLVMRERPRPRGTRILLGGDFLRHGAPVDPGAPAILTAKFNGNEPQIDNRLDFARWLVSPENALTARVTVNRFWQQLFGRGLVESSNDFGTRGTPPSHPDLLEWLARSFVDDGWSVKSLLKRIVLSQTYRQSSHTDAEKIARDPRNVRLARQERLRLDAEVIRDSALVASGLLSREVGGAPVKPPLTPGGNLGRATPKKWSVSIGSQRFRRSLYTWHWRTSPYPFYATFDAPTATIPCSRRQRTNTPLQALMMANDPMMIEIAAGLGRRVLEEGGAADDERIERAFRWCYSREPHEHERNILTGFLDKQREGFDGNPDDAARLLDAVYERNPEETSPGEAATWIAFARVLLNLDAFVIRD